MDSSGENNYNRRGGRIISICDHGLIVNELKNKIEEIKGLKAYNSKNIDLLIKKGEEQEISAIFEVKTDCETSSIYTGIGICQKYVSFKHKNHSISVSIAENELLW